MSFTQPYLMPSFLNWGKKLLISSPKMKKWCILLKIQRLIALNITESFLQTQAKRKLQSDRRQLAEEVKSFQASKETERKKLDEERKWVRREKLMFEKSIKDKKSSLDKRTADEIAELQAKVRSQKTNP